MARAAGAGVILINGQLAGFLRRKNPALKIFLPESEPERSQYARELAQCLAQIAIRMQTRVHGLLIATLNDAVGGGLKTCKACRELGKGFGEGR